MTGIINEEWRSISEFANYQVSNIGRVRNVKTESCLKPNLLACGYYVITLCKNGITSSHRINRLVAQEFIHNPESKPNVDHIDHNTKNNCINNLRWVSQSQNCMNRVKQSNTSSAFKGVSFNKRANKWKAYIKFDEKLTHLRYFVSEKEAAKKYNEYAILHFGEHALINEFDDSDEETD